jgi:uncharacterized protein (DUF1778 family)
MPTQARKARKNERLSLRVSMVEKTTLESASQSVSMTTSEFVIRQAMAAAEEILADRTRFLLSADQWEAFSARLDQPPRAIPAIKKLMAEPAPFDER